MNMSSESLLVILLVGLVVGWLAGQIVQGTGFGLFGDLHHAPLLVAAEGGGRGVGGVDS